MLGTVLFTPYGRTGTALSALIVVSCLIGLTMHSDFYAGRRRRDFFCYYTNVSNLIVLLYFALVAPALYATPALHALIPHVEFIVTMCIALTFCVFHLLLSPAVRIMVKSLPHTPNYRIMWVDNLFIHYIVPWLTLAYWILCSPGKSALKLWDAPLFTLIPLLYLLFIFLRARKGINIHGENSPYPYPFLDCNARGIRRVMRTCMALFAICLASALWVLLTLFLTFSRWGGGHAFILI